MPPAPYCSPAYWRRGNSTNAPEQPVFLYCPAVCILDTKPPAHLHTATHLLPLHCALHLPTAHTCTCALFCGNHYSVRHIGPAYIHFLRYSFGAHLRTVMFGSSVFVDNDLYHTGGSFLISVWVGRAGFLFASAALYQFLSVEHFGTRIRLKHCCSWDTLMRVLSHILHCSIPKYCTCFIFFCFSLQLMTLVELICQTRPCKDCGSFAAAVTHLPYVTDDLWTRA